MNSQITTEVPYNQELQENTYSIHDYNYINEQRNLTNLELDCETPGCSLKLASSKQLSERFQVKLGNSDFKDVKLGIELKPLTLPEKQDLFFEIKNP